MRRSFQKNPRSQKSTKLALLALGFLFLILVLGKLALFLTSLQKPLNLNIKKQYSWDGKSSLNLAFISSQPALELQIAVITLDPKGKKSMILSIPNKTYTELPKDLGWWEVGSIYKLGQEENPPAGDNLLKMSLSKMLGLPIDGIIILNNQDAKTAQLFIAGFRSNPISALTMTKDIKTDLTPVEIFQVYKELSQLRGDRIIPLNLERSDITESKLLKDSSRVLGIDSVKLDLYIRQNLADSNILEEGKSIAVFNGTDQTGLAAEAARIITNMGGNVVILTSIGSNQQESGVYAESKENNGMTFQRLAQVFAPNCLKKKCENTDPKVVNSRADISIVLGRDYLRLWHER